MKSNLLIALATTVTLAGAAHLGATQPMEDQGGCANFAGGYDCTAGNAESWCKNYYKGAYPGCTVSSASCSSTGNYNCFVTP